MSEILEQLKGGSLLLPVCGALVLLVLLLLICLIRAGSARRRLAAQVEHQKQRVRVRKKKIYDLRKQIRQLKQQLAELQEQTDRARAPADAVEQYRKIAENLRTLAQRIGTEITDSDQASALTEQLHTLSFQIRKALGVESEPGLTLNGRSGENGERRSFIGCRVLVADDDAANCALVQELLESAGMPTDKADSAEAAVDAFLKSSGGYYDMILMDIVMGGMSGYEAASVIRQMHHDDSARIPIVAMTANSFSEDMEMIMNAGMNDRIVKPITREKLMPVVTKWLGAPEKGSALAGEKSDWSSLREEQSDRELESLFSVLQQEDKPILPESLGEEKPAEPAKKKAPTAFTRKRKPRSRHTDDGYDNVVPIRKA